MPRYELPPDLTPEEERATIAALERALGTPRDRPTSWTLAGRAEALRMGALQVRRDVERPWTFRGQVPFARPGTPLLRGRGDAK
ncbi:MAG: hypothetical protein ACRDKA_09570 [Actinomycetota bacterium]